MIIKFIVHQLNKNIFIKEMICGQLSVNPTMILRPG